MSRIFYIVKKIDERLIQGVQVAVVQSFQLLPGLLSFHMTGSIHRHILVSILASLVCIILSLFIDQPTILLAINLRDSFGFYSTPLSEALIGKLGILNISALSLLAILVIGYLCALIRKNEINLGSVLKLGLASILAATTVLTTHFILIATVQFIFVMLIFWEVMGSLGAGRHRSCATFVSSQLISFLLIIASADLAEISYILVMPLSPKPCSEIDHCLKKTRQSSSLPPR